MSTVLLAVLGCSGPKLTPIITDTDSEIEPPVVLPAGARCAEQVVAAQESKPPLESPAPAQVCPAPAPMPGAEGYSPVRPLGIGYPGADNTLPAKTAYLTFDDGPSEWTPTFLDILRDKNVKATFFITAKQLKGQAGLDGTFKDASGQTVVFRDLVKRELDEGHGIADHTVDHPDIARITPLQLTNQIEQDELLINRALVRAGAQPHVLNLFRPPYGSPWFTGIAGTIAPQASERIAGHALNIMWTVSSTDASDWAQGESYSSTTLPVPTPDAPAYDVKKQRVIDSVLQSVPVLAGDGFVVLMHDTHQVTRDVLPQIIDGLVEAGYTFDTIENYVLWRWNRPSIELTPGPGMYDSCVDERNWGCEAPNGAQLGTDRGSEVCGRMWVAYHALGGIDQLGLPIAAPEQSPDTGIYSQRFEKGTVELHPENPPPCNFIALPQ
ncbi:MAG TPA: polysaccharide deacetylase family protein [Polyangiaceae bacterium]|nr:polysaccharide deacetylase family protein [Polyangiaceae bacterium]